MNSITEDPNNPGRISLAYRNLTELPSGGNSKYGDVNVLDLSHNNLSYPFYLANAVYTSVSWLQ